MTWKTVVNADAGDADHFGGNDIDKISQLFAGTADVDIQDIDSLTYFRSSKFGLRDSDNTHNYLFSTSNLSADRTVNLPLLTGNDVFVFNDFTATLINKTLNATNNTITDTSTAAGDILKSDGTKFTRFAKGSPLQVLRVNAGGTDLEYAAAAAGDMVLANAQTVTGAKTFNDTKILFRNPADTFSYTLKSGAIVADRQLDLPVITGTDTLAVLGLTQTFQNKTLDSTCSVNTAALPSDVVKEGIANDFGDFDNSFKDNRIRIWNPADTFRYTIVADAIATNRNINLPLLVSDDTLTVRNTCMSNPYIGAGTSATLRRTGLYDGTRGAAADGILGQGITSIGTSALVLSSTEGPTQTYDTTASANANAGLRWTVSVFRREYGIYMVLRVAFSSTSDIRAFIGWSSSTAEIAGETTLNNFSGAGVGKRTGDTNWFTYANDGDATENRADTGVAFATSAVTIELELDATSFRSKIGSTTNTAVTTELPASATDLSPHVEIETGAGAASKVITIMPIWTKMGPEVMI